MSDDAVFSDSIALVVLVRHRGSPPGTRRRWQHRPVCPPAATYLRVSCPSATFFPSRTHPAPATRLLPWLRGKPVQVTGLPLYSLSTPRTAGCCVPCVLCTTGSASPGRHRHIIASGKPFRPSTQAIRISFRPRFLQFRQYIQPSLRLSFSASHIPGSSF